jgi:nuclear cap-binding protein subunit 1
LTVFSPLIFEQSVPATYDPNGTVLRSLIHDIIDLYETNRKECAKILLELPLWVVTGTFKSKSGDEEIDDNRKDWVLENMVVEVRSTLFPSLFQFFTSNSS